MPMLTGACSATNEWGGQNLRQFFLLLDTAAAITYSQRLSMKGPGRVGQFRGAVVNHYLIMWPAASFCVARITFAKSL